MNSEHVRLSPRERIFGEKNLLISQLSVLNFHKNLKEYKRFRKEEFLLKFALKTKIEETVTLIDIIDKLLPRVKMYDSKGIEEETPEGKQETKEHLSMESELYSLKQRIAKLGNM